MRHSLLAALLFYAVFSFAEGEKDIAIPDAPSQDDSYLKIDAIQIHVGDAFDDSKYHTKYDKWAYDFLNWVHIETRESVIRKLLLFDEGDSINSQIILEAERFLRTQNYLSDANISIENIDGKNIAQVSTSDNWTLAIPTTFGFSGSQWKYKYFNYGIGIQESNFLGFGQKLGFYYGHDEFRNMLQLEYSDPHFLFRYNHLDALYSYNTDGYLFSAQMYMPFLSRSQNQWAYTIAGLKNKRYAYFYGSGDMPAGATPYNNANKKIDLQDLPLYNGDESVELMKVEDYRDDSLSLRISRSFGGVHRKLYLGATYDYRRSTAIDGKIFRYIFTDGKQAYALDSAFTKEYWIPDDKDSRLGLYLKLENFRYEKIRNFHNVKWTEDIEKGYSLKFQLSRNFEQMGANNSDIRLDFWGDMYLGTGMHHITLKSNAYFYLDHGERRDFYGRVSGEYIFHPTNTLSTVLYGMADFYEDAPYGRQLSLGGSDGFAGFPTGYYTGQARVYGSLEQRYFTSLEVATLMPVFALFGSVGETAWDLDDIRRKDLIYVLGLGIRFAQTKSISRLINKLDISFPVNGERKGDAHYSITTTLSL
ncbi:MAG: hypothetical protein HUK20_01555 [Fibrobacter sp.]|nr:hypothetical protein [Fibrobacter sp.]